MRAGIPAVERIKDEKVQIGIVTFLGVLMRLGYVLYTPFMMGQHDLTVLGSGQGHLGYIEYFLEGGQIIHDFDPMTRYQFYHPPLSHLLSAAWVRLNLFLGTPYEEAFERLQCLSLLYSVITLVLFGKILAELGFRGRALLAAYLLAAFHPTFYLFAGSINNDGLCLMFMTGAVLYTLRWYRKQSMGNILLISLFLLGGIWTKQNTFLITPAIGFVFLYVLVKNWKDTALRKDLLIQFLVFGAATVPLGLAWSVYNYIKFGMPFDFTPAALTEFSSQDVGGYTLGQRLFGLKDGPLRQLSVQFRGDFKDYNIGITLLKTSVFGEYILMSWGLEYACLIVLTIVNGILAVFSVPAVLSLGRAGGRELLEKRFVFLLYVITMAFYIRFCFQYPKVCSMDFRYIALTVLTGSAAFGWFIKEHEEKLAAKALVALVVVWSLLSIGCYIGLGITPRAG